MKNYKRVALTVRASQYFPYNDIDVEGFRQVIEEVLDPGTMIKIKIVRRAEVQVVGTEQMAGTVLPVEPGDWVVKFPDGSISVRSNQNFLADFVLADSE